MIMIENQAAIHAFLIVMKLVKVKILLLLLKKTKNK